MAKRKRIFKFHGAYSSKSRAKRKEHSRKGAFILDRKIGGHMRHIVVTRKKK